MGISHGFAPAHEDDREPYRSSFELVCSYDLNGDLINLNSLAERVLGYSRDEAIGMNIRSLMGEDAWEFSNGQVPNELNGSLRSFEITTCAKQGHPLKLAIMRRILYETGHPIAIQDNCRMVTSLMTPAEPAGDQESRHSANSVQLDNFAEQLKQLNRLSTTAYESLDQALEDHLKTGCRLFGLPIGIILQADREVGVVRASIGSTDLLPGAKLGWGAAHCASVRDRLRTLTYSNLAGDVELHPEFATCIRTPILLGSELFGTLSFSSSYTGCARTFQEGETELLELMARGIARYILDHRAKDRHIRTAQLEESRNQVLETLAANHSLDFTLHRILRMLEHQRPGLWSTVLLRNGGALFWAAASGFPNDVARLFKPIRLSPGRPEFVRPEMARTTVFWDNVRDCPIWAAERSHFAAQMGITSCLSAPILSGTGRLLGLLTMQYRQGQSSHDGDPELLQMAGRLAALAIEQRKFTERLEFQAMHDSLTGLSNRAYFIELLEKALEKARERSAILAVLFIDLDRFKQINDTLGHTMGDRLLKEVGGRLRRLLTEDDLAGRMGGDEFTIVLTRQPDEQTAIQVSQEFLKVCRAPYRIEGNELFVTASIGLSIFPKHGTTAADLLRNADLAMYHAKNGGKNDLELFHAEDHVLDLERLRLENALRRALANHEFELLYQPLVNIDGFVEGLEALLVWRHPVHGTISPKQFIPIAEETGLIIEIGSWVIRQACMQGAQWLKSGYRSARISVNVSALQFERRDFVQTVSTTLALSSFPAECLELELTESYVMRDLPQYVRRMNQLRDLGVSISIDDFGTGYSSLSYLNKLPVDSLKIDQSFLRGLQEPEGSLPVVQSIVRLAHSMNLTVVAEGVETLAELELVRELGCDKVQGHIYGPSLRQEEAEALLRRNQRVTPVAVR
jgi:diguanylate cyclase (GGDEF)-like protein/PAS domain S-box-containing protein